MIFNVDKYVSRYLILLIWEESKMYSNLFYMELINLKQNLIKLTMIDCKIHLV